MNKWTDIFFSKVQTLLGERGKKSDQAVRWRDLTTSSNAATYLDKVTATDPRVEAVTENINTIEQAMAGLQDEINLAFLDAAAADTKAQLVRDDHDSLVLGFVGTLTNAFANVETSISASIESFEAEFRDPATGQIKASALTGYYTASGTDGAIAAGMATLQASLNAVEESIQGWQVITVDPSQVTQGAAVTVALGASSLGQTGTLLITEGATARVATGTTNGAIFTVPTNRAVIFAGQRIKIGVLARAPSVNAATKFGIAYSTNDNGVSGYLASDAVLTTNWAWHVFYYDVPQAIAGGTDYLAVFGDDTKTGKTTEIARVYIEIAAVAGELPEINTLSGQITDILGLNITPETALATSLTTLEASVSTAQNAADNAQLTADGAVSSLSTLSATVTTQGSAIATLEGNASAGYLIKAQAGGAVSLIDLIAADGTAGPTSIIKISATDILLDGTVTAPMLAANSVLAQHISVSDLSAISANLGSIQVGSANILDAAIGTLKVAGDSITLSSFVDFATQSGAGPYTFSTNVSMAYGGDIIVIASAIMFGTAGDGDTASFNLYIDGTPMTGINFTGRSLLGLQTLTGSKAVFAGSRTITVTVSNISGVVNPSTDCKITIFRRFR